MDRKDKQIERLKERLAKRDAYVERLKSQNAKLKAEIQKLKNERKKERETDFSLPKKPVQKFIAEHNTIWVELSALCREWNLKTINMRNTVNAINNLIKPDEFGVVNHTDADIVNYIRILRKIGRQRYVAYKDKRTNEDTLNRFYAPTDSIILFKHYERISHILLLWLNPKKHEQEQLGYKTHKATANGVEYDETSAVCSLDDLKNQVRRGEHINDNVPLSRFKGDDLIREKLRREIQKSGYADLSSMQERMKYLYTQVFGEQSARDKIIVETTPILDEDDEDLTLNDFKEVK